MNHPLRNFQRGPTWSSNNDPLVARNRIMDDLQFLPGIRMKSIVDRDSGTIGILECCSITTETRREGTDMPESNIWILRDRDLKSKRLESRSINGASSQEDFSRTASTMHTVISRSLVDAVGQRLATQNVIVLLNG